MNFTDDKPSYKTLFYKTCRKCPIMSTLSYPVNEDFFLGKIEEFNLEGLEAFFRSSDHDPAHFHVKKKGAWEIRVYILTPKEEGLHYSFKFQKKGSPSSKEEKAILNFVIKHREKLLLDWQTKVCVREIMSDES